MKIRNNLSIRLNQREQRALDDIICGLRMGKLPHPTVRDATPGDIKVVEIRERGPWESRIGGGSVYESGRSPFVLSTDPTRPGYPLLVIDLGAIHQRAVELELREKREHHFHAMFYPNAMLDDSVLKLALVYFDKVYILFPDETAVSPSGRPQKSHKPIHPSTSIEYFHGDLLGDETAVEFFPGLDAVDMDVSAEWNRLQTFYNQTEILRREGILNFLSPQVNVRERFFDVVQDDLSDKEFVDAVSRMRLPFMYLGGSKLPQDHSSIMEAYRSSEFSAAARGLLSSDWRFGTSYLFGLFKLPPVLGMSILLNHALLCCAKYDLTPMTDKTDYEHLFLRKLHRSLGRPISQDYSRAKRIASGLMALQVLHRAVPLLQLADYEDVLECRHRLEDELERFRSAMDRFVASVHLAGSPLDLHGETEKVIDTQIIPAISDMENKLRVSKGKFFQRLIRGAKVGVVPIVATALVGVPIPYLLAISAGVVTLEAVLETKSEQDEIRGQTNGLSFVLDVRRIASRH